MKEVEDGRQVSTLDAERRAASAAAMSPTNQESELLLWRANAVRTGTNLRVNRQPFLVDVRLGRFVVLDGGLFVRS